MWMQILMVAPNHAWFGVAQAEEPVGQTVAAKKEILKYSHISYRALGGFTGAESYGVLVSCIEGKISVLKSIHNPRFAKDRQTLRQIGTMSQGDYLDLWNTLHRQRAFEIANAPPPTQDLRDEFTYYFEIKAGPHTNAFDIYGMSRPAGARYHALRSVIDRAVNMSALWREHNQLAKR